MVILLILLTCVIYFWVSTHLFFKKSKKKPLTAPGPIALPIVGHLPFLGDEPHKKILAWQKNYGPIISVRFGSMESIVINDAKLIKEAYSLPQFAGRHTIFGKLSSDMKGVAFTDAVAAVEQRSMIFRHLYDFRNGGTNSEQKISEEVQHLLEKLERVAMETTKSKTPVVINDRFHHPIMNFIWNILAGTTFDENDSDMLSVFQSIKKATYQQSLIEDLAVLVPWIGRLFPSIDQKVTNFNAGSEFSQKLIEKHNETRIAGQPRDFTDAFLDRVESTTDPSSTFHATKNFQPVTTRDIFLAAVETTSTALEWTIINLVQNPRVQSKLFEEIVKVTGHSRLPCLSDRPKLPYLEALIHEVLRMTPVIPLIVFRSSVEDTVFQGYDIKKDTAIVANVYAAHNDPNVWGDPDVFRPERFIDEETGGVKKIDDYVPFGWGKRHCPGQVFARDQLFLYIASLVQKFHFEPCDQSRKTLDALAGFINSPKEFKCSLRVRS